MGSKHASWVMLIAMASGEHGLVRVEHTDEHWLIHIEIADVPKGSRKKKG